MFEKVPIMGLANAVNSKDSKKGSALHNFVFPVRSTQKDPHSSFQCAASFKEEFMLPLAGPGFIHFLQHQSLSPIAK